VRSELVDAGTTTHGPGTETQICNPSHSFAAPAGTATASAAAATATTQTARSILTRRPQHEGGRHTADEQQACGERGEEVCDLPVLLLRAEPRSELLVDLLEAVRVWGGEELSARLLGHLLECLRVRRDSDDLAIPARHGFLHDTLLGPDEDGVDRHAPPLRPRRGVPGSDPAAVLCPVRDQDDGTGRIDSSRLLRLADDQRECDGVTDRGSLAGLERVEGHS
jgi:hypothetical protein